MVIRGRASVLRKGTVPAASVPLPVVRLVILLIPAVVRHRAAAPGFAVDHRRRQIQKLVSRQERGY
jgi:hypothetical protein